MNINSKVEIGKFYFITVLFSTLSKLAAIASKPLLLVRAAFTSITAFSINGQTIYNLLKLLIQHPFKDLPPASLTPLQQQFINIHYLILNKKLMIRHIHLG